MAKSKKKEVDVKEQDTMMEEALAKIPVNSKILDGCDFCMQFDYDEPIVVGASPDAAGVLELTIRSFVDAGLVFMCPNTGKKLRLFARELTDKGREILEEETKNK